MTDWQDDPIAVPAQAARPAWMSDPVAPGIGPSRSSSGLMNAITAGWQGSATGLAVRGRLPDVVLDSQHAKWYEKLASSASQMVSELPEMVAGSAAGAASGAALGSAVPGLGTVLGGIVGGGSGAFAAPAALRTALMERYQNGEVNSASDFLNRAAIVMRATGKEALVGGLTAGTGVAAKPLGSLVAKGAEVGTMTLAPALLEGKLPEPEDFLNAAIMVGGMHAAGAIAGRMRGVYAQTGRTPLEQVADAKADPAIAEDLAKPVAEGETPGAPKAYQPLADEEAVRNAVPGLTRAQAQDVAAEFFGPTRHVTDEPNPIMVNSQYLNTPTQVDGAMVRLSELAEEQIQAQRRGTVPNAQTEVEAEQVLRDFAGADQGVPIRRIGEASNASQLLAWKWMLEDAANRMGSLAKQVRDAGTNISDELKAQFMASIDRCALVQQQFLGARAEAGRALQILQNISYASDRAEALQRVFAAFKDADPAKVAEMVGEVDNAEGAARMARRMTKVTKWDMVMEAWKAGLLGPLTVVKKALTDTTLLFSRPVIDTVAYGINRATGSAERMSGAEPLARIRGVGNLQSVKEGLAQAWNVLKYEHPEGVLEKRQAIPGLTGQIIRSPFRAIEAVTQLFECMERRGEAYALAAREAAGAGLDPLTHEFWDSVAQKAINPTEARVKELEAFGKRMTFQAPLGTGGRAIQRAVNKNPVLQPVVPFIRTPINILKETARLSPFAPLLGDWRADFGEGGIARNKAVAEMAVGSALATLAASWAVSGRISGSGDPDPDKRRVAMASGWQPYSIKLGDKWYSYRQVHPLGTLLGMVADIHEVFNYASDEEAGKAWAAAAHGFGHAVTEQTFLEGLKNAMDAIEDPDHKGYRFVQNMAASVVPATVTQIGSIVDHDPNRRVVQTIRDAVEARIPGLRESLQPLRDPYGEPVPNGARFEGISPIKASPISNDDPVRTEAARLGVGAKAAPRSLNLPAAHIQGLGKVPLSEGQQDIFGDVAGHMAHTIMEQMVQSPAWQTAPDFVKQRAFTMAFEHANKAGRAAALTPEDRQAEMVRISNEISQRLNAGQ